MKTFTINGQAFTADGKRLTAEVICQMANHPIEGVRAVRQYFVDGERQRYWPIGWMEDIESVEDGDSFVIELGKTIKSWRIPPERLSMKYKNFAYDDWRWVPNPAFGGWFEPEKISEYIYENPRGVRDAATKFIDELGDKFVAVTGGSIYAMMNGGRFGEITVWYKE